MAKPKIDVVSDDAYPWCLIGCKRLDVVMLELAKKDLTFAVARHVNTHRPCPTILRNSSNIDLVNACPMPPEFSP